MSDRALPARMIDLVRDGVRPADLRESGERAVYNALVRTAASAQQRGWTYSEWAALLSEVRSTLGRQVRVRRDKERTRLAVEKTLRGAWDAAATWLADAPAAFTRDDALAHVETVRRWIEDADADLTDAERQVLAAACDIAAQHGTTRPALPRRALVDATGLGERTVRTTLARLHDRRVLVLEVPGRSGAAGSTRRRAGLYRLPDADAMTAYQYRGTRSMGPLAQVYGTPAAAPLGTPVQTYGTPDDTTGDDMPAATLTLTLTADEQAAVLRALAEVRATPTSESPSEAVANVVPLRRREAR